METEGISHSTEEQPLSDREYLDELALNPRVAAEIAANDALLAKYIPDPEERDNVNRQQIERTLKFARIDGLTGLIDQTGFKEAIASELKIAKRLGVPLSVLFIDLDFFKKINDEHGHPAGDAALRAVSDLMRKHLRPSDTPGRLGGDEFGVLLPAVGHGSVIAAKRLHTAISNLVIPDFPEAKGIISASIGLAYSGPEDTVESLYKRADQGALWTKHYGRNGISVMPTPGAQNPSMSELSNVRYIPQDAGPAPVTKGR